MSWTMARSLSKAHIQYEFTALMKQLFAYYYHPQSLMSDGHAFSRLIEDYGNADSRKDTQKERNPDLAKKGNDPLQYKPDSAEDVLMQLEERSVGAVPWGVYKKYLHFAGGIAWAPVILLLLILTQGSQG